MPARLTTTRRAALGGAVAVALATTGCDADVLDPRPVPSTESPAPPEAPDAELTRSVVADIRETAALVDAASADPDLAAGLAGLAGVHRDHLALLDEAADDTSPEASSAPLPSRPARRRSQVLAAEAALQQRLAEAALKAVSGDLAAVFASMSAALAQQVALLTLPAAGSTT